MAGPLDFDERYLQLEDELNGIATRLTDPLQKQLASLALIQKQLEGVRSEAEARGFVDQQSEIAYLKFTEPRFQSLALLETELYHLERGRPAGSEEQLSAYYVAELEFIERYFRRRAFHYEYYRSGATELDQLFFLRGVKEPSVLLPVSVNIDSPFTTPVSQLFAQFRAFEMLRDHLVFYCGRRRQSARVLSGRAEKPGRSSGAVRSFTRSNWVTACGCPIS